jgi:hypothetical protein
MPKPFLSSNSNIYRSLSSSPLLSTFECPFEVYWEAVGRNWLVCLLEPTPKLVAKLVGRSLDERERMVLRSGGTEVGQYVKG